MCVTLGMVMAGTASAQTAAPAFTGPHVDGQIGLNRAKDKNVLSAPGDTGSRKQSPILRGAAGYDLPISENAIIGAEVSVATGGRDLVTKNGAVTYRTDPGFTLDATTRIGFKPHEQLLLFGKAGWAMQRVTVGKTIDKTTVSTKGTEHGMLWGIGAEYALTPKVALRTELDRVKFNERYSRSRIMSGVSLRF